jgi:hypothetical protein
MAGVTRNEPIQCGPPLPGEGHGDGGQDPIKPLFPFAPDEAAAIDYSSPLRSGAPLPVPQGENSIQPSVHPPVIIAEKNDPLLGPASDQRKWKRSLNTGSRKHCVSKFHSFLSLARHSRGQVYRDFINSLLSVANGLPSLLACNLLISHCRHASALSAPGRFAPRGVAW